MRLKSFSLLRYLAPCVAVLCALAVAAPAQAADSLAPPGAKKTWLPAEPWVLDHWLPYDQNTLLGILGMNLDQLRAYFNSQPGGPAVPTLAALLRSRGLNVNHVAHELLASWHPRVPAQMYAVLLDRTLRTLTQGHLMQHMLFHTYHDNALNDATPRIFGVTPQQLHLDLLQGIDRIQIGSQQGRSYQQMVASTLAVLRGEQALGVREHDTPASEAGEELAQQTKSNILSSWLQFAGPNPQADIPTAGSPSGSSTGHVVLSTRFTAFSSPARSSGSGCCCCCCCCGGGAGCSSVEL